MKHLFSCLLYCKYAMFYFLQKLSVPPFKKLTPFPLFEIKNFRTCRNRFFTKIFFPNFGRWGCKCHDIVKSAGCQQITNLQNTTTLLQNSAKTFIKGPISKTWDQESIRKISNWVETDASSQSPFWK